MAEPQRHPARRRDPHAVRADDGDVVLGRPQRRCARRPRARRRPPPLRGRAARRRARRRRSRPRSAASARARPTSRNAHSGVSGSPVSDGEALVSEHRRAVRVDEPGRARRRAAPARGRPPRRACDRSPPRHGHRCREEQRGSQAARAGRRAPVAHAGASAARASSAATAASPSSPRSTRELVDVEVDVLVGRPRPTAPASARARTRGSSSGCAKACSTERADRVLGAARAARRSRSARAQIAASGTGRPVSPSHHAPRSATCHEPVGGVGEAALVDDQARRPPRPEATASRIPVVAHLDDLAERGRGEAQQQVGRRVATRGSRSARLRGLGQRRPPRARPRAARRRARGRPPLRSIV